MTFVSIVGRSNFVWELELIVGNTVRRISEKILYDYCLKYIPTLYIYNLKFVKSI